MIFTDRRAPIASVRPEWDRVMYYVDPDTGRYSTYKTRCGRTTIPALVSVQSKDVCWDWEIWGIYMPDDLLEWLPEQ